VTKLLTKIERNFCKYFYIEFLKTLCDYGTKKMNKNQDIVVDVYQPKKKRNLELINFMQDKLSQKGIERMFECSTFNQFITTKDKEKKKMIASNTCKNRFCPICTYRKARTDGLMVSVLMKSIQEEKNQEFLFLTLTTPNVKSSQLTSEIDRFNHSFKKLFARKQIKKSIKGYIRKLELTYNKERDDYNPHFHVILSVNKSYFTDKDYYISQKKWLEMWRECTGLNGINEDGTDEITQVHISKVRKGLGKNSETSAINEIAKYSAKDSDMLLSEEIFNVFYENLKGRQLLTFNGLFKEYKKKFENKELEKYFDKDKNEYFWKLLATWDNDLKKYEQLYELLNEYEFNKFNGKNIEELEIE